MTKSRYRIAALVLLLFVGVLLTVYVTGSGSSAQVIGLPINLFIIWIGQPVVAVLAWILSKKFIQYSK